MDDLTDPQGRLAKPTLRRGLLLAFIVTVAFVALTKIFPRSPVTAPPQPPAVAKPGP